MAGRCHGGAPRHALPDPSTFWTFLKINPLSLFISFGLCGRWVLTKSISVFGGFNWRSRALAPRGQRCQSSPALSLLPLQRWLALWLPLLPSEDFFRSFTCLGDFGTFSPDLDFFFLPLLLLRGLVVFVDRRCVCFPRADSRAKPGFCFFFHIRKNTKCCLKG